MFKCVNTNLNIQEKYQKKKKRLSFPDRGSIIINFRISICSFLVGMTQVKMMFFFSLIIQRQVEDDVYFFLLLICATS